jgi:ABC-2 type transport system ATP-binding protein
VLEGYRRADDGRAAVLGLDPVTDHDTLTHRIGVMLQTGGVGPGVRVLEALRHAAALYEHALEPHALLERVGLTGAERRTWRQISGGEQRRLALALALVGRPQVAFLDEPSSGVDPVGRHEVRDVIASLRDEGATVLLTSHDLDEVERLADHVVILDHGRVLAAGTPEALTSAPVAEVRFAAPSGVDVAALSGRIGAPVEDLGGGEYLVRSEGTPHLLADLTAWMAAQNIALRDLRAGRQRLEDVFLRLVAEATDGAA